MKFNPGIKIGDKLSNKEVYSLFQCANMQGIRPSSKTGTVVVVSDYTKGLYEDVWKNGVLHYTGMGKVGDQVLKGRGTHNHILYYSDTNGVEIHLFEVVEKTVYTYRGVVVLADKPYQAKQLDTTGILRKVWIFPLKPVSEEAYIEEREPTVKELIKLSNEELARRTNIKLIGKKVHKKDTITYYRDPYLKEMVKRIAGGKCQYCGEDAPFLDKNNVPYLEEHHVKRLADGGSDTMDNVVAICPNCHCKMHVLNETKDQEFLLEVARQNDDRLKRILVYQEKLGMN